MPELPPEGVAQPSDVLLAGIALVQHGFQVAGLAEEVVLEDNIVQSYPFLAYRALQTVLMPGKYLP